MHTLSGYLQNPCIFQLLVLTHHRRYKEEDTAKQVFQLLTHHRRYEEEGIAMKVEDSRFPPASYSHLENQVPWSWSC